MNDLISRSVLMKAFESFKMAGISIPVPEFLDWVIAMIDVAPAVDAAPQWISVEERLPEDDSRVLVAIKFEDGVFAKHIAKLVRLIEWMDTYNSNTKFYWMPLPLEPKDGDTA